MAPDSRVSTKQAIGRLELHIWTPDLGHPIVPGNSYRPRCNSARWVVRTDAVEARWIANFGSSSEAREQGV
jgi:hypothetical protein